MTDGTSRRRGRRVLLVAVTLAVALSTVVAPVAVGAQDGGSGPPPVPAAYHGEVTIDGEPAPAGATVEAVVDGEVLGSIQLDEEGYYGSASAGEQRLVAEGTDADRGENVTFYVNADGYERGQADHAQVTWTPQDVQRVDLAADLDQASSGGGGGGFLPAPDDGSDGDDETPTVDAAIGVDPASAEVGEEITFSGADSTPADSIVSYEWSIAGESASGETVTRSFESAGTYNVELTVTTDAGGADVATTTVTVAEAGAPTASISIDPAESSAGDEVTLSGADSSTPRGELTDYEWSVDGETYTGEEVAHTFDSSGTYTVELTVTNDAGASDTASESVTVSGGGGGGDGLPGFGFAIAVIAILAAAGIASRRQ